MGFVQLANCERMCQNCETILLKAFIRTSCFIRAPVLFFFCRSVFYFGRIEFLISFLWKQILSICRDVQYWNEKKTRGIHEEFYGAVGIFHFFSKQILFIQIEINCSKYALIELTLLYLWKGKVKTIQFVFLRSGPCSLPSLRAANSIRRM